MTKYAFLLNFSGSGLCVGALYSPENTVLKCGSLGEKDKIKLNVHFVTVIVFAVCLQKLKGFCC